MKKKLLISEPLIINTLEEFHNIKDKYHERQRILFTCIKCHKETCKCLRSMKYPLLCKSCTIKQHFLDTLGVENPGQCPEIKKKIKSSFNKKYDGKHPMQTNTVKEKVKKTILQRYNVESFTQSNIFKEKSKNTKLERYGDENFRNKEKQKQTLLNRYGNENYNNREKAIKTYKERFGVEQPLASKEIYNKGLKTKQRRYGSSSYNNRDKAKTTCLEKYGVEHQMQNSEIESKTHIRYKYNEINFDSSWELAYYIWLKDNNIEFEYHPKTVKLFYEDKFQKIHRYFPDFYIDNCFYEIKGDDQFVNGKMINKSNREKDYIAEAKQLFMLKNNVKILRGSDIKPILKYIKDKYGKDYLEQFRKTSK